MFMTYMSLSVVADVTMIMIIDMIRPMVRIPPNRLFCDIDLGTSCLYEHLAPNHRFFSKKRPVYRTSTWPYVDRILRKRSWRAHKCLIAELICNQ